MSGITRKSRLPLLFLTVIMVMSGGFLSAWTTLAQDGVLPLPGISSSRAFTSYQVLTASDGAADDRFGQRVAVDGDVLVTGTSRPDSDTGAAYIFERDGSGFWSEKTRLTSIDTVAGDEFGRSVDVSGNTAVVSAPIHEVDSVATAGAVYIFTRDAAGVWSEWQTLTSPSPQLGSQFGYDVAIDGDRIVVSATGEDKVYIYTRNASQFWELEDDLNFHTSIYSVSLDGDTLLLGAMSISSNKGSAYIYKFEEGTWKYKQLLAASDGVANDSFGSTLMLQDNQAYVFAYLGDSRGAVYMFSESGGTWTQTQKIVPDDPVAGDNFGIGIGLEGNTLALSAYGVDSYAGAVYIFNWNGSAWVQDDKLLGIGGSRIALQGIQLFSGNPFGNSGKGRIHVYNDPELIPTATPPPAVNLLIDGGFEANANGWTVKNTTGDKTKCNKAGKVIAYTGSCAWRFKGGAGENAKLQQIVTSGFAQGATLLLSGYANTSGDVNSKIKVVVAYTNPALQKSKITVDLQTETSGVYAPLSAFQPALTTTVTSPPDKIKVQIKNSSISGKIYYDDLSLTLQ